MENVINKVCNSKVKVYCTRCVLHELEVLGDDFRLTCNWAKRLNVHKCGHKQVVSAADCLLSQIGKKNEDHWWLATQDRKLRDCLRSIPCAPCWFFCAYGVELERPSDAALLMAKEQEKEKLKIPKQERGMKALQDLDRLSRRKEKSLWRRNVAKGPNPLSCKKKQLKVQQEAQKTKKDKRKRPRRKGKLREMQRQNEGQNSG